MTTSPALELQALIVSALKADATLSALIDGVYDQVPDSPWGGSHQAYISFGPSDVLVDDADCIAGETHTIQMDVWSRSVGMPQCKKIASAVKDALHQQNFTLTDNAFVEMLLTSTRFMRDPDGLTNHAALSFTAMIVETE